MLFASPEGTTHGTEYGQLLDPRLPRQDLHFCLLQTGSFCSRKFEGERCRPGFTICHARFKGILQPRVDCPRWQ